MAKQSIEDKRAELLELQLKEARRRDAPAEKEFLSTHYNARRRALRTGRWKGAARFFATY
jgi:hypothetical protein